LWVGEPTDREEPSLEKERENIRYAGETAAVRKEKDVHKF
jgi:hypothetical protein